jgi:8-oxo-dGTP pyrophosphatase MutT (NUDIX family)
LSKKKNRKQDTWLTVSGCVALDFDGVLSKGAGYHWPLTEVNLDLIKLVQDRGYAAAIVTCNDVAKVAAELRRHGLSAVADPHMVRTSWHDRDAVLVTNRKIAASLYVDDKAVCYLYGQPASVVLDALDEREGFRSCPLRRHWGVYGAAGVLPFTVFRGRVYVLLGERGKHVQQGGTWSAFGGALDHEHEDTWDCAVRELHEEVSGLAGNVMDWLDYYTHECEACGWWYVTFLAEVPAVDPAGDADAWLPEARVGDRLETRRIRWVRVDDVADLDLHPGFAEAWPRLRELLEPAELAV